jgi:hypothetical protein
MQKQIGILIALALSATAVRGEEILPGTETPGFHGMLIVGQKTPYVSHLPMFMPQHRYQGIWEVSFGDKGDATYRAERARPENAGEIFTLAPKDRFLLPDLTTTRNSFKADVFRGHFERPPGRKLILQDVTVTLKQQVHWHPFRTSHKRPEPLTYVLFGQGDELFLAHWISVAPNYDQLVSVTLSAPLAEISRGTQLILPKRGDGEALKAGESVSGTMIVDQGPDQPVLLRPVDLKVASVIYLEKGELESSDLERAAR